MFIFTILLRYNCNNNCCRVCSIRVVSCGFVTVSVAWLLPFYVWTTTTSGEDSKYGLLVRRGGNNPTPAHTESGSNNMNFNNKFVDYVGLCECCVVFVYLPTD